MKKHGQDREKRSSRRDITWTCLMRDPGEGVLDRAMALSLSAVVSAGCLRFFVPWASTVLARAIDITSADAPACIQGRKLREEAEREEWNEDQDEGEAKRVGVFFKRGSWERRVKGWLLCPSNLLLERRGVCDLTSHWALLRCFDWGSLSSLYYGVI